MQWAPADRPRDGAGRPRTAAVDGGRARLVGHGPIHRCGSRRILKNPPRSPHPTPFAQPIRLASSQVRSPNSAVRHYLVRPEKASCRVTPRPTPCPPRRFPTRLTQPTLNARSARTGRTEGDMGVGCVKIPALTRQTISAPWCVERNTSNPPDNAESFRIVPATRPIPRTAPNHSGLLLTRRLLSGHRLGLNLAALRFPRSQRSWQQDAFLQRERGLVTVKDSRTVRVVLNV